jgi:glycosyltransferase involved in cell wall biosynthesis
METSAVTAGDVSRGDNSGFARQETPVGYLVIVRKGPTWAPEDLEPLCRLLSRRFVGEIWAFGSYDADIRVERFRLRVVSEERSSIRIVNLLLSARQMLRWAAELRSTRVSNLAVVSVDPFKGGLLAQYVARRANGVFICEINGVYADRNNLGSSNIVWIQSLRLAIRRRLGAFVISRAAAVRLLFADQLQGFVRLPTRVLMRRFFDITPIERFYPGAEEPIILGVGFPFRVKGFDILCRAFHSIASEHPGWKLVLIGYRAPEQLHAAGLEHPQIEARPGVLQPELAEWMSRCAIFALPSRTEAMGRVLIEAGAAGKCRVASRIDGIPTVIEDGVDGLLVEKEDVGQLAATLARLIGDVALRRRLGEAARERTQRDFSGEIYIEHYAELVSCALKRRGA